MAIEELHDTIHFHKVRIPLSDFLTFPEPSKNGCAKPHLEHPQDHFRSRPGFYLCTSFYQKFWPHLRARPSKPDGSSLFVWTLRRDCAWGSAMSNFEGKNQPVPWWVIRPFLGYVATGEHGSLINSVHPIPFFMEARNFQDEKSNSPVRLRLDFSFLNTEWRLEFSEPLENSDPCPEGQTFLSFA